MKVKVENLETFPCDAPDGTCHPYWHDMFHMGQPVAKGWEMMFPMHQHEEMKYLIFVNKKTGERVRITFEE